MSSERARSIAAFITAKLLILIDGRACVMVTRKPFKKIGGYNYCGVPFGSTPQRWEREGLIEDMEFAYRSPDGSYVTGWKKFSEVVP